MDTEAQGPETGTGEEVTPEFEAPTNFKEAFNPVPKPQGPSELGTGFLKGLPPEDAAKLEPYVKQWDSAANQRFQKIHDDYKSQLSQYEGIDVERAREAIELDELIRNNPREANKLIQQMYLDGNISEDDATQLIEQQTAPTAENVLDGLPPEIRDRLLMTDKLEQGMKALLAERAADIQAKTEAHEIGEFVKTLDSLDTEYTIGGVKPDRNVVLRLIASDMEPKDAYEMYKTLMTSRTQEVMKAHNDAPTVLGSGNMPPIDNTPVHKLSEKDRRKAVLQYLNKGN